MPAGTRFRLAGVLLLVLLLVGTLPATGASAEVVTSGQRSSKAVALTFDDGISRSTCARIARTLRGHRATGTFFVNGRNLRKAPAKWRRILDGQPVGNHTFSHHDLTGLSDARVLRQLRRNEALHERILGRPMLKVFRPPYAAHDARIRRLAGQLGYRWTVLWNVDTRDWSSAATAESIVARATGAPAGSIILMHCSRRVTADALPAIIRHYRSRGIAVVGLMRVLDG